MTVLSGLLGSVGDNISPLSTIRSWQISTSADIQKYISSANKNMSGRITGNKDWSGSYNAYGHTPEKLPGQAFIFAGSIDGSVGATGTAIVDSAEITIDIASGAPISHVVNFSGNGALSFGAVEIEDDTDPTIYPSIGCKIMLAIPAAVEPDYIKVDNLKTITLSISSANQSYIDSTQGGIIKRLGGVKSAALSFAVNTDAFSSLPAANIVKFAQVFITGATYWDLQSVIFGAASNLTVDRETAAIIGATLNAEYTGYYTYVAGGTVIKGTIVAPDSSVFWE